MPDTDSSHSDHAIEGVLKAFARASVVAIGEAHQLQNFADFVTALICHPSFAETADDIVVEFGNSRYQDLMDAYVAGAEVNAEELQQAWRNTTQLQVWDSPIYAELFRTVREVNRGLPAQSRLRVVLGDSPIDWAQVRRETDLLPFIDRREADLAEVVEREVIERKRQALLLAGSAHVARRPAVPASAGYLIEQRHPGEYFVILTAAGFATTSTGWEAQLRAWRSPVLAELRESWVGELDAAVIFGEMKSLLHPDAPSPYAGLKLRDMGDAYLFLGRSEHLRFAPPPREIYAGAYAEELARRRKLVLALLQQLRQGT